MVYADGTAGTGAAYQHFSKADLQNGVFALRLQQACMEAWIDFDSLTPHEQAYLVASLFIDSNIQEDHSTSFILQRGRQSGALVDIAHVTPQERQERQDAARYAITQQDPHDPQWKTRWENLSPEEREKALGTYSKALKLGQVEYQVEAVEEIAPPRPQGIQIAPHLLNLVDEQVERIRNFDMRAETATMPIGQSRQGQSPVGHSSWAEMILAERGGQQLGPRVVQETVAPNPDDPEQWQHYLELREAMEGDLALKEAQKN